MARNLDIRPIQDYYNDSHSMKECIAKFGFADCNWARRHGLVLRSYGKTRTLTAIKRRNSKTIKPCEYCKKAHDGKYASGRFCSQRCARIYVKKFIDYAKVSKSLSARKHPTTKITCAVCGKIKIADWPRRHQKYCSRSCASKVSGKIGGQIGGKISAQKQQLRSKNEIAFAEMCKLEFKNVLTNERLFSGWDADVILPDLKIAILWNGLWHYKKLTQRHSLEQVQSRDRIKIKAIELAGFKPVIIKDPGGENPAFVLEAFKLFKENLAFSDSN